MIAAPTSQAMPYTAVKGPKPAPRRDRGTRSVTAARIVESWTPMPTPQTPAPITTAGTDVANDSNGTTAARNGSTTRPRSPRRSYIRPDPSAAIAAVAIAAAYRTGTHPAD